MLSSPFLSPSLSATLLPLPSLAVTFHFLTGLPLFLFSLPLLSSSPSLISPFLPLLLLKGVEALPDTMKPWKDLTDRFDELSIWLEELEERVESDLVKEEEEEEEAEEEGGDPSDTIVKIKVKLKKF